jgi:hypothetical protein
VVPDVAFQDFSHESVDGPAAGGEELQSVGTFFMIVGQSAFYGFHLTSDPGHSI